MRTTIHQYLLRMTARAFYAAAAALCVSLPAAAQTAAIGAPSPDSLARLVMARFTAASPDAFDSVYTDPLGREVMRSSVAGRSSRRADLQRVIWTGSDRAVLLLGGVVLPARERPMPLDAAAGSDDANRVRRFSGLYDAVKTGNTWMLGRQIPIDTLNFIRAQAFGATITPGKGIEISDTLTLDIGSRFGFIARFNSAATIARMTLDGKPIAYDVGGGVFWFAAKPKRNARLVIDYALVESRMPGIVAGAVPAYGAYHNTDAWLPFFGYDNGNHFARITATVRIPEAFRLTTSLPQAESVANGVRTVVGRSMHPQFIVALAYDREWKVESTTITTPVGPVRVETFLTPGFAFSHDTLVKVTARTYDVLSRRFGEPQAPTRYVGIVANRALGRGGFAVRMNNLVVGGSGATMLDDAVLAPSYVLAHELSHGWTMNASSFASNMLQEGWATYAEGTVLGDVYGKDVERAFWERQRAGYANGVAGSGAGSFEGRLSILESPDNGRIHYVKGSWVFRQLERALGRETFDRGIRDYVAIRRDGKPAGYREFIQAMSTAAGRDLTSFIMPWLDGRRTPDIETEIVGDRLVVRQVQPDLVFQLPLDVVLTTASGTVERTVTLTTRADTIAIGDVGAITDVRVDPEHYFLLQRHMGEVVRFEYPVSAAPDAKSVELTGNFVSKPMSATRVGDVWVVELPITEGRYIWQWRIDGATPSDQATYDAVRTPGPAARAGFRTVRPLQRLDEAYPR